MLAHKSQENSAADGQDVLCSRQPMRIILISVSKFRGWPYTGFQRHSPDVLSPNPAVGRRIPGGETQVQLFPLIQIRFVRSAF